MLLRDALVSLGVRGMAAVTNAAWTNTNSEDTEDPETATALAAGLQYRSVTVFNLDGAATIFLLLKECTAEVTTHAIPVLPRASVTIDFEAFALPPTGNGAVTVAVQSSAASSAAPIVAEFVT